MTEARDHGPRETPGKPTSGDPTSDELTGELEEIFRRPESAARSLERVLALTGTQSEGTGELLAGLRQASDPDRALLGIERTLASFEDPADLFSRLRERPRSLGSLLVLLGASRYLTEILLRHPDYLETLIELPRGIRIKERSELIDQCRSAAIAELPEGRALERAERRERGDRLRREQQRELLRIGAADLLVLLDLPSITEQLSHLADAEILCSLELARSAVAEAPEPEGFFVLALGKLGGGELNYSSDIDLVFVSRSDPTGYWTLVKNLVDQMSEATSEGFLYRVDLRLRPWGRDGALVNSVSSYLDYLDRHARGSELQSLIKARVVAGDRAAGLRFLEEARRLLYRPQDPEALRTQVRSLKEQIESQLRRRGQEWGEVKSGVGSIRDIEFTTQYLQLLHAHRHPTLVELRSGNTLTALNALLESEHLPQEDYRSLVQGYVFLRTVEHHLQLVENRQVHRLPEDPGQLQLLAHRLGFERGDAVEHFLARYEEHRQQVRQAFARYLDQTQAPAPVAPRPASDVEVTMPASYSETFSPEDRRRHDALASQLGEHQQVAVNARPLGGRRFCMEIVGFDALGYLSVICGLLYAYRFNILDGHVFTADDPGAGHQTMGPRSSSRRRTVDVFTVRHIEDHLDPAQIARFSEDLNDLMTRLAGEDPAQAQAELAKRVAMALPPVEGEGAPVLYPIDIEFDNRRSPDHTVVEIEGQDTLGFLYELSNALTLADVSIEHMEVRTLGARVRDTLWVTDRRGRRIIDEARLQKLRVTVVLTKHFTHLLPRSPNPERALLQFRQFLGDELRRENWESELPTLDQPKVLAGLARLLGVSDFLWQDFLRMQHENLFPVLSDLESLREPRSRNALREHLRHQIEGSAEDPAAALNAFKDREMFRVDMRKILGHGHSFEQFSKELTELAEVIFEAALDLALEEQISRFGQPLDEAGEPIAVSLCALGKFGGRELGFASDLELMLIYGRDGRTDGERSLRAAELFARVVESLRRCVRSRKEGIFEVDLRLRPYGASGPLAVALSAFEHYFGLEGDAWPYERQSLTKLRPALGDARLGKAIVEVRDRLVYGGPGPDLAAQRALRERQVRHLVAPGTLNAKYSRGCLVDVEYLVQALQLRHGGDHPRVRSTNTLAALGELHDLGVVDARDYDTLAGAYRFLRLLIDALRMVRGNAKDLTVPAAESEEFGFLARRFGSSSARLLEQIERYLERVPRLESRLLG